MNNYKLCIFKALHQTFNVKVIYNKQILIIKN